MGIIFKVVYKILMFISALTGLTYNEINIIVYYILIPFVYVALIDKILKKHILKSIYVIMIFMFFILIKDFATFSDWLFDKFVIFLLSFQGLGWSYTAASVIICVFMPCLLFAVLVFFAFKENLKRLVHRHGVNKDEA